MGMRKKFELALKARIVFEATIGEKTLAQISFKCGVDATQISKWKLIRLFIVLSTVRKSGHLGMLVTEWRK